MSEPANDRCSSATFISILQYEVTQDIREATVAGDEPVPSNAYDPEDPSTRNHPLWFTYTPSENMVVKFSTLTSDFDSLLSVWTGSCGSFTEVGSNEDFADTYQSQITLNLVGGTTYYVLVTSYDDVSAEPEPINLNLSITQKVASDSDPTVYASFASSYQPEFGGEIITDNTIIKFRSGVEIGRFSTGSNVCYDLRLSNDLTKIYAIAYVGLPDIPNINLITIDVETETVIETWPISSGGGDPEGEYYYGAGALAVAADDTLYYMQNYGPLLEQHTKLVHLNPDGTLIAEVEVADPDEDHRFYQMILISETQGIYTRNTTAIPSINFINLTDGTISPFTALAAFGPYDGAALLTSGQAAFCYRADALITLAPIDGLTYDTDINLGSSNANALLEQDPKYPHKLWAVWQGGTFGVSPATIAEVDYDAQVLLDTAPIDAVGGTFVRPGGIAILPVPNPPPDNPDIETATVPPFGTDVGVGGGPPCGTTASQIVTIHGTNFPNNPVLRLTGPHAEVIPVTILSSSSTAITFEAPFVVCGSWAIQITGYMDGGSGGTFVPFPSNIFIFLTKRYNLWQLFRFDIKPRPEERS
jgi:hypothetical protein